MGQGDGAEHVELGLKLAHAALAEEVDGRAGGVVVAEAGLVEHAGEIVGGVVGGVELGVGVLDEHHDGLLLAHGGEVGAGEEARAAAGRGSEGRGLALGARVHLLICAGHVDLGEVLAGHTIAQGGVDGADVAAHDGAVVVYVGIIICVVVVFEQVAVLGEIEVAAFVAHEAHLQGGAVGLRDCEQSGLGGHCESGRRCGRHE